MKKALLTLLIIPVTITLYAQTSGGPDAYGYIWRNSSHPNGPTFNWIDIDNLPGTITVTGLADDNIRGPYVMPFTFQYYWYKPSKFWVGSNGYIGFTNVPVAHPFPSIPTQSGINDYVAVMTTDLTFTDNNSQPVPGASCKYWVSPTNDTLIVTWKNVPFWNTGIPGYTGLNTFQVILTSTDSSITFQYLMQNGASPSTSNFVTTGIENNSGTIGLQVLYNIYPTAGTAVKFYAPSTTTLQINDASTTYCNNPTNGGLFLSRNGSAYVSVAEVANTGNQPLSFFNVYSRVVNSVNQIQVRDTVAVTNLSQGQSQVITFPDTWIPTGLAGVYRHITETLLAGDATPGNNQRVLELQVVDTTQTSILLSFDNGVAASGGLGWSGGGGGAAMHFIPPFTPCLITKARYFITADNQGVGFHALVFDDSGPNGGPGNRLDSIYVPPFSVIVGSWTEVTFPTPLLITSGGFYVTWMMGGDGIFIGQNQIPPISNRSFEVLGTASNPINWADYRYREIEDLMINAYIEKLPLGMEEGSQAHAMVAIYPNPISEHGTLAYAVAGKEKLSYSIFAYNGQLVEKKEAGFVSGSGSLSMDLSSLQPGIYLCVIEIGQEKFLKKISVVR